MIRFILLLVLVSCADLTKVNEDPLAKENRIYRMRIDKPMIIYHRKCQTVGTGAMGKVICKETEIDLLDEWSFFAPSFMLAPYREFFP